MFSIIIPTYNEADGIVQAIAKIQAVKGMYEIEIIVVDSGSTDDTVLIAKQLGVTVVASEIKSRAAQMNKGASIAKYDILYFLHADSIPPDNFTAQILKACRDGAKSGSFRLKFDYDHPFLKANAWFTRFNINAVRFGDQSLFVTKDVFEKAGGFREDLLLMEDQEIIHRLKSNGRFLVMNDVVITSARKYLDNGVYRMQVIFYRIWAMYYLGFSQERLLKLQRKLVRKYKL